MKGHETTVNWTTTPLDGGRMLLIKVTVPPEGVRANVALRVANAARRSAPKGFRPGSRVAESAVRRIHGKKILLDCREELLAKSWRCAVLDEHKKRDFGLKNAGRATNVVFSEEQGLSFDVLVTGLTPPAEPEVTTTLGGVVDLRPDKAGTDKESGK